VESMGPILDRTKEHVGTADLAVIAFRRMLLRLARQLQDGIEPYAARHGDAYRVRSLDVMDQQADLGPLLERHATALLASA
jgi:phthalate 4,5-dioxygenase